MATMHVYIVVVNWNGWKDTLECLESLFRIDYPCYTVVVCDNDSSDGSIDKIRQWARGELVVEAANPELRRLVSPPIRKPVNCEVFYGPPSGQQVAAQLVIISTGSNLGFAGGNNVGLRFALSQTTCDYVWMLNNDTVVEPDALAWMVRALGLEPTMGICGSAVCRYDAPSEVQAAGGNTYDRWSGRVSVQRGLTLDQVAAMPKFQSNYVDGASMLVPRQFLEEVGLLEECYFLYFEEVDWAMRARGRFSLGFASRSIVYHKEGASIGTHRTRNLRSLRAERYLNRNRILFTRKHFPLLLPSVMCWGALAAIHRCLKGDPTRGMIIFRSLWEGFTAPTTTTPLIGSSNGQKIKRLAHDEPQIHNV
jgi:GT2 family glycosyltransferase